MNSNRLAKLAVAALRDVIRLDPAWRAAAWAELKFRHQSRQAFMRENGAAPAGPAPGPADIIAAARTKSLKALMADLGVKPWQAPDLSDPEPPREGPMV